MFAFLELKDILKAIGSTVWNWDGLFASVECRNDEVNNALKPLCVAVWRST